MYRAFLWGVLAAWPCVVTGEAPTARRQIEEVIAVTQEITAEHTISATLVQNNTQRSVYNWIRQSDENQTMDRDTFMRTVIPVRYPFVKSFEVVYFNAHDVDTHYDDPNYLQLDMNRVAQILTSPKIARGTYIGIDLEVCSTGQEGVNKWMDYNPQTLEPNLNVINARAAIITASKAIRPDCFFGYYNVPQADSRMNVRQIGELEAAEKPVMAASDFIAPSLYWARSTYTAADMANWAKFTVELIKKYYPNKKIIPFTAWTLADQMTADMMTQSYQWTLATAARVTVSGPDWRQFLNALSDAGVNDIILYIDGTWMPWDPQAPWWLQTCDWASTPRKSRFEDYCNSTVNPRYLRTRSHRRERLPIYSMGHR